MSADELVCHVRDIAKAQHLSFHYGTSEQPFGTMATFRLVGDDFELLLLNPEKPFTYDFGAYDLSDQGQVQGRAVTAYSKFRTAVLEQPAGRCRK